MPVYTADFTVTTSQRFEIVDITDRVEEVVEKSGIRNGVVMVFVPHATAAIILNEYEPRIASDYVELIKQLFKPDYPWRHNEIDNNAHAHLASAVIGPSRCIPLFNGRLWRGTWQNILLVELDGPRTRRVVVQVVGE